MQMIQLFILMLRSINKIKTKRTSCYQNYCCTEQSLRLACHSCLTLNVSKTMGMYFSINRVDERCPYILVKGEVINIVKHFKYLVMIMDSNLNFKKHIKKC